LTALARVLRRLPGPLLSLIFVGLLLLNLAIPLAVVVSSQVFGAFASMASLLLDMPSVREKDRLRTKAQTDQLNADLIAERKRSADLDRDNRLRQTQIASSNRQLAQLKADGLAKDAEITRSRAALIAENDLAEKRAKAALMDPDRLVRYRGEMVSVRQAVTQTSSRARALAARIAARNLGSMAGESVPFWGVAVIVAATTWELTDTCTMMTDFYILEIALIGVDAVKPEAVCGLQIPTVQQLRASVAESPAAVAASAKQIYGALPDFQWQAGWGILMRDTQSLFHGQP